MQNLSPSKQLYYAFLGRAYAFAYQTHWRRFLGYRISSWLKFLTIVLFLAVLVQRRGTIPLALTLSLVAAVQIFYWRTAKSGYHRFLADDTVVPPTEAEPLASGQRVKLFASGLFALVDREERVLLRPAEFWRSGKGEYSVMVNQYPQKYLYQFFRPETLQNVQPGWLIHGRSPLPTLAITFWQTWGPEQANEVVTYMVGGGVEEKSKRKSCTIYFTFTDTAVQDQVWLSLKQ
jgi:hypothetical protein